MNIKKSKDNINNQIRYYKNKYNYIVPELLYNEFKSHIHIIKKVFLFHDFIVQTNQYKIPYEKVEFYARNYDVLKSGFSIKYFLLKLKKNNNTFIKNNDLENNDLENKKIILIEF